jgi:hypothetical protein
MRKKSYKTVNLTKAKTEVELCNIVKKSNLFPGFTLHEEVGMDINGNSCDMVYHKDYEVYCIEAKLDFNFKVVAQAERWIKRATKSYIAVPYNKARFTWKSGQSAKVDVCNALGIGIITVYDEEAHFLHPSDNPMTVHDFVWEQLFPNKADMEFWRIIFERIGENKVKAGSQHGERSTPFLRTIEALRKSAIEHPDYSLKQLLEITPTHYCHKESAASAIRSWASKGIIEKFWK